MGPNFLAFQPQVDLECGLRVTISYLYDLFVS